MKWFSWNIELNFEELDWGDIEECLLRNGVSHPEAIVMTGPCLPGIN